MKNNSSIKISEKWNKPYRKSNKKDLSVVLELSAPEDLVEVKKEKVNSNIVFVIDTSGSMAANIVNDGYALGVLKQGWNGFFNVNEVEKDLEFRKRKTKLEQVVSAVISSISLLNEKDSFSIVTFSNEANVIFEIQNATLDAKHKAFSLLSSLIPSGGTSLFKGWETGVKQLSKKSTLNNVNNRVVLLTDGQATDGVNETSFCKVVSDIADISSITTTTFGVGEGFNENLLLNLANDGEGNFYFIDEKSNITEMFEREMFDVSNIVFKKVKMSFEGHNFNGLKLLNDFKKSDDGLYSIPNIIKGKKIKIIMQGDAIGKDAEIKLHFSYIDNDKNTVVYIKNVKVDISSENYQNSDVEEEVINLVVGKIQKDISANIQRGNILNAKENIKQAKEYAKFIKGENGNKLIATLNETEKNIEIGKCSLASKTMAYSSYCFNYSK